MAEALQVLESEKVHHVVDDLILLALILQHIVDLTGDPLRCVLVVVILATYDALDT